MSQASGARWSRLNPDRDRAVRASTYQRNAEYTRLVRQVPCMDCGGSFSPCAMQFDHVRGVKRADVSRLVSRRCSLAVIQAEIAKCDIVCANCHCVRTAERASV